MEDPRLLTAALALIAYALVSRWLTGRWVSMPAFMVIVGLAVGFGGLGVFDLTVNSSVVRAIAEVTLALMLFHDAARIRLSLLWKQSSLPARLLGIGLPVMIVLGTLVGYAVFPSLGWIGAALIATMLAPTDAALGEEVVSDSRLPGWLRQGLNVESGLNDGLSVPVFLVLIIGATVRTWSPGLLVGELAKEIGFGLVSGIVIGGLGGLLVAWARRRELMLDDWVRIAVLAIALGSYVLAALLGGSGFIGAFVGGLAFGRASHARGPEALGFTGHLGSVFDALSFLLLGAVLIPMALPYLSWQVVLYAVLSLVAVRMASVFVATAGTGAAWQTKAFMGWFGPRGLATVVFSLLLLDEAVPNKGTIAAVAVTGVVLSVYAHGFTAPWLSGVYAQWYEGHSARHDSLPEQRRVTQPPLRSDSSASAGTEAS
jgi:NhaP-type Na+/H+ or K+/H+ antiporter